MDGYLELSLGHQVGTEQRSGQQPRADDDVLALVQQSQGGGALPLAVLHKHSSTGVTRNRTGLSRSPVSGSSHPNLLDTSGWPPQSSGPRNLQRRNISPVITHRPLVHQSAAAVSVTETPGEFSPKRLEVLSQHRSRYCGAFVQLWLL